ncbi:MAG: O-antigen ligase family protein [Bacteroidales bacterium]|nr:O-antigen ligase family protein [Bacteroidales bacterium]
MISLIVNYILELDFKRKFQILKDDKSILIFSLIFLIHLIWFFNTQNFKYAFHDIGNKAILILYPIIIGTSEKFSRKRIKIILLWFSASVVVSSLISTGILVGAFNIEVNDIRDISPFISHIRFSLLINVSIFSLAYFVFMRNMKTKKIERIFYFLIALWLVVFLFLLKSLTGILIFSIVLFITLIFTSFNLERKRHKILLQSILVFSFIFVAAFLIRSVNKYYTIEEVDFSNLETKTVRGNLYKHFINNTQVENGNYVWIYVCDNELMKEWEERSDYSYNSTDAKNQKIRTTIIRYLSSKGLRKDSVGIASCTEIDIKNIESGLANYIYENKFSIYPLIYKVIWQIDVYLKGNNPAGNSITQRIEFLKAAKGIVSKNLFFGVGTGDVQDSFNTEYEIVKSKLPENRRHRAHNQYVTFLLTFGIFGFMILFFSMIYPIFLRKGFHNYLFIIFLAIALLSFINEDTLETQTGVTFFSYFYSLFLFGSKMIFKNNKDYV